MKSCPKCKEPVKGKSKFCPSCGEKVNRATSDEKRARLTEEKKSAKPLFFAVGALVAVSVAALAGFALFRTPASTVTATPGAESGAPSTLTFPIGTFDDGQAKYFSYKAPSGKNIKFFALKSSDGIVRAAFDACDVCYAAKKGYRQEGNVMVCNNCGQKFASTRINEVRGGCNPAPLERKVEGSNLMIAVNDVLTGARYF
jgi:uncharacterized membrane protein